MNEVHPTAIIDPGAKLGEGVTVGPYAIIGDDVVIGDGCTIGPRVTIHPHVRMGENNQIHTAAVIGDVPQDLAFDPATVSYVEIGAGNAIREMVNIHRGTKPDSATRIGNDCMLMTCAHFAHDCQIGNKVLVVSGALIAGYATLQDQVFISGNVTVHQYVRVGRLAMIGGLSGVTQDVLPFCTHHSVSLNRVSGLNVVGMRRAGFGPEERKQVKQAYRILFDPNLKQAEAVQRVRDRFSDGPALEMAAFADESSRGLAQPDR